MEPHPEASSKRSALLVTGDRDLADDAAVAAVSVAATLLSLILGIPPARAGAGALSRPRPHRSAVNTGIALPPVVVGLFVTLLLWRSGPLGALELLYTPVAIAWPRPVIAAPIVTGLTLAAVQQLPARFRLQLLALGASRPQMVWLLAARGAAADARRGSWPASAASSPRSAPP